MLISQDVKQIIQEIDGPEEKDRRALAKKRHDIYRDGGKAFLVEQIQREFSREALKEMRLAPVNILKKIINKRAQIYKKKPVRSAELESDKNLIDYYSEALGIDVLMQKANRAYCLQANTVLYPRPVFEPKKGYYCIKSDVIQPYLYSVVPDSLDKSKINAFVFNAFVEEGRVTPQADVPSATGVQSYSKERGYKSEGDKVASNEINTDERRQFIFWSDEQHFTTDNEGNVILSPDLDPQEQVVNPIGEMSVVNITKDRDNEPWAIQGEDMIDITIAIQLGWSDLLTIAKHQGFSLLTISSEEEPKKLTMGINKAIWLRTSPDGNAASMQYVQAQSPLDQYKNLLMELLGLLLTTNDMDPGSIGGKDAQRSFTSGFHQLIAMSDNIDAVEADKPVFMKAELHHWDLIAKWHNALYDANALSDEARALGKFSEDFKVMITFSDVKPLSSEDEILTRIEKEMSLGLITRFDAMKRRWPDLTDDQIKAKIEEIESEKMESFVKAKENIKPDENTEEPKKEDMIES